MAGCVPLGAPVPLSVVPFSLGCLSFSEVTLSHPSGPRGEEPPPPSLAAARLSLWQLSRRARAVVVTHAGVSHWPARCRAGRCHSPVWWLRRHTPAARPHVLSSRFLSVLGPLSCRHGDHPVLPSSVAAVSVKWETLPEALDTLGDPASLLLNCHSLLTSASGTGWQVGVH